MKTQIYKLRFTKKHFCLVFLLLIAFYFGLAQTIMTEPEGVENNPFHFFVEKGGSFDITFSIYPAANGTWEILDNPGDTYDLPSVYNFNDITGIFNCPQLNGNIDHQYYFSVKFNYEDTNIPSPNNVTIFFKVKRPGVQVMLVLDRSGSMGQIVSSSSPYRKWDILINSVSNFLTAYGAWELNSINQVVTGGKSLIEDEIGIVFFDHLRKDYCTSDLPDCESQLYTFNLPDGIPDVSLNSISDFVVDNNILPRGSTCFGGGIFAAYDAFNWGSHRVKHIIVFSDGLQNTSPLVDQNALGDWVIPYDAYWVTRSASSGELNLTNDLNGNEYKIHTISIGDNYNGEFMHNISSANTGSEGYNTHISDNTALWYELPLGFLQAFNETLNNFTPTFIDRKVLIINGDDIEYKFNVNHSADRILIQAVGSPSNMEGLVMNVTKEGEETPNWDIPANGPNIHFFMHKEILDSFGIEIGGQWNVTFTGKNGSEFSTTCIVNDEYIDYDCSLEKEHYEPGDPITCNLKVWAGGKPISDLDNATVYLLKPGEDVNDLFANAPMPTNIPKDWPAEPGNFKGQDKYEKLIALDSSFVNKLKRDEFVKTMINAGDNTFTASFSDTEKSGVYKFIFKFSGHDENTGIFQRYYTLDKVIDFGQADEEGTVFHVGWIKLRKTFTITPKNKFGYLIGPNRLGQINLELGSKKLKLEDNLDGTYFAKAPFFSLLRRNTTVKLDIKSANFTKLKYKEIDGVNILQDVIIQLGIIVLILILLYIVLMRKTI